MPKSSNALKSSSVIGFFFQVIDLPIVIPDFQERQVPHDVHVAFHLRRLPQNRRNQDPSLLVDLHGLTVVVRPGQELLLGAVVRGQPGQFTFQLFPDLHRVNLGDVTGFARDVELLAKSLELFQKGRGNFESALLVHPCRNVSP